VKSSVIYIVINTVLANLYVICFGIEDIELNTSYNLIHFITYSINTIGMVEEHKTAL